jgi:hypothetical protein
MSIRSELLHASPKVRVFIHAPLTQKSGYFPHETQAEVTASEGLRNEAHGKFHSKIEIL